MLGIQTNHDIAIIHPHATLRMSLKDLIQCEVGYTVVLMNDPSSTSAGDLLRAAPDLIITDGVALQTVVRLMVQTSNQHHQNPPILVLSPSDDIVDVKSAFRLGAKGYIPLDRVAMELMDAIGCLIAGQLYMGNALKTTLSAGLVQEIFA